MSLSRALAVAKDRLIAYFGWCERRHAAQVSRDLLDIHRIVSAGRPGIPRRELYTTIVMIRTGATRDEAEATLERAEESFATWPANRPLTFRDVVHYLAVTEYLRIKGEVATRTDMGQMIAERIAHDL